MTYNPLADETLSVEDHFAVLGARLHALAECIDGARNDCLAHPERTEEASFVNGLITAFQLIVHGEMPTNDPREMN